VVYETRPCLRFKKDWHPFAGNQAGGRIALDKDRYLYLTVGDFEFDGKHYDSDENKTELYPQLVHVDYGKTLRFDPHNWSVSIFTIGHKNPQGIAVDDDGGVWETEHGPMGGDELNLLQPGNNYGWPLVTLGVGYTDKNERRQVLVTKPAPGPPRGLRCAGFRMDAGCCRIHRQVDPRTKSTHRRRSVSRVASCDVDLPPEVGG
jgi:hypothetical protein